MPRDLEKFKREEYARDIEGYAFIEFVNSWIYDDNQSVKTMSSDTLKELHEQWVNEWIPSLSEPHCGDCTNFPAPCTRCHTDQHYITATRLADVKSFEERRREDRRDHHKDGCSECIIAEKCGGQL